MFLDSSKVRFGFRYGLRWGIFTNKKNMSFGQKRWALQFQL
jgi:hypothetical protein